jgi:hypothetical protein
MGRTRHEQDHAPRSGTAEVEAVQERPRLPAPLI